jgi:uncharacterized surface protein with fasciclin (FAS1) repeats
MDQVKNVNSQPTKNIVETAVEAGSFTTLAAGLKAAGLLETLAGKGPFTVFAPSDDAFKKLPHGALEALLKDKAKLKSVLTYHVVSGHLLAKDLKSADLKTVEGSTVHVTVVGSKVQLNESHVTKADIAATNGVIHVIDAVMLPKNVHLAEAA